MLFWENERLDLGVVHHLLVLCFHLQHHRRYSPEGLRWAMKMLADILTNGVSARELLHKNREQLSPDRRQ
jgi:hypothetical protein